MTTIDIVIAALLLWSAYNGWRHGLIKELVSTAGFFVGLFIAYHTYNAFGAYLAPSLSATVGWSPYITKMLAFILIWVLVPVLLGLAAGVLTRTIRVLRLGSINALAGALVCMAKYMVLMSFVFCAMDFIGVLRADKARGSVLYGPVASIARTFFQGRHVSLPASSEQTDSTTIWIDIHH